MSPAARRLGPYFPTRPDGDADAGAVVGVLRDLPRHLRGTAVVVWDGGGGHKGPLARAFPRRNRRPTPERLPADAPAPNPVEAVWPWPKSGRLPDAVPAGIPESEVEASDRRIELRPDAERLRALRGRSDLPFPKDEIRTALLTCRSVGTPARQRESSTHSYSARMCGTGVAALFAG